MFTTIAEELDINRGAARLILVQPKNITNDQIAAEEGTLSRTFARNQGK
jgi:orotate phosphoribosyltransferase-like protein